MWQPGDDKKLVEMWPDFSAKQIAKKLGCSRNAVIGRFHRINKTYADGEQARKRRLKAARSEKRSARREVEAAAIAEMKRRIASGFDRDEEIRKAYRAGAGQPAIGDVFGITRQAISLIVKQ